MMNVLILAGGKGLRLRPYTTVLPKPLMPIGERPILERLIFQLKESGYTNIYLSVGYLASIIQAYFGNGENFGVNIQYIREDKRLGTAGPLSLMPKPLEPFLVLNGDLVTNLNFKEIYNYHLTNSAILTIGIHKLQYKLPLGFLETDSKGIILDYVEKPIKEYNVSMGVYMCSPEVFSYIPFNEYLDFPNLAKIIISNKQKIIGFFNDAEWLDIGRPEEYERAIELFSEREL